MSQCGPASRRVAGIEPTLTALHPMELQNLDPSVARGRRPAPAPSVRNTPTASRFRATPPARTGCPARHSGCSRSASPATAGPAIPTPGRPSAGRAAHPRRPAQRRRPRIAAEPSTGRSTNRQRPNPSVRLASDHQQVMWCWIIHRGFCVNTMGNLGKAAQSAKDGMTRCTHMESGLRRALLGMNDYLAAKETPERPYFTYRKQCRIFSSLSHSCGSISRDGECYPAFLTTVGQTFLSAKGISATTADRNVCPTKHAVVDLSRVVRNADYPRSNVFPRSAWDRECLPAMQPVTFPPRAARAVAVAGRRGRR